MGRVILRHQEAEKIIAKAKEQAIVREKQIAQTKTQIPPEASILGCWQIIEKNILFNANPDQVTGLKLGDCRIYFTVVTPEKNVFGRFISSGGIRLTGPLAQKALAETETYDLSGKILKEGTLQYLLEPKRKSGLRALFNGAAFMTWFFRLNVTANWQGWELEGTATNKEHHFEEEFKAVRIDQESGS